MPRNTTSETKKNDLLARKEKLIQELNYYEKRIEDFHANNSKLSLYENASSDSDEDLSISLGVATSLSELKKQNSLLETCLKATQELTSLSIVQTHDSIMVENPVIDGVMVSSEPGTWREVAAECYIDLVSFSVTFYTHQPSRKFAAASYHGLEVLPVKRLQEAELSHHSLLASATCPSDAVDVLRSYAIAYRSRRTTLHRLAKMFTKNLFMEPLVDGGFVTKYSNLLQICWHLENYTSTVAPFQHKMKFQIEYIEESYLKIIKQLYKQLANPLLETDERTSLLAKLISTCGEAHPHQDSESDLELDRQTNANDHSQDRNTRTDRQDDADERVMAPPKTIPKKAKLKGKENSEDNHKSMKRSAGHVGENGNGKRPKIDGSSGKMGDANQNNVGKKAKTDDVNDVGKKSKTVHNRDGKTETNANGDGEKVLANDFVNDAGIMAKTVGNVNKKAKTNEMRNNAKSVNDIVKSNEEKVTNQKTKVNQEKIAGKKAQKHENVEHVDETKISDQKNTNKAVNKVTNEKDKKIDDRTVKDSLNQMKNEKKVVENNLKNSEKVIDKAILKTTETKEIKSTQNKIKSVKNIDKDTDKKQINNNKTDKHKLVKETKLVKKPSDIEEIADGPQITAKKDEADVRNKNTTDVKEKIPKNHDKTTANNKAKYLEQKVKESIKSTHPKNLNANINEAAKPKTTNIKTIQDKETAKNYNHGAKEKKSDNLKAKNSENVLANKKITDPDIPKDSHTKNNENIANGKHTKTNNKTKNPSTKIKDAKPPKHANNQMKLKSIISHRNSMGKVKNTLSIQSNISKVSGSKIPQKKLSPAYAAALQQMPVRTSPRMTKLKSVSDSNLQKKIAKPVSNIPRLLKPAPKSK